MKKDVRFIFAVIALFSLSACYYDHEDILYGATSNQPCVDTAGTVSYSQKVVPVLQASCYNCHTGSFPSGNQLMGTYAADKAMGQNLPPNPPYQAVSTHYRELLGRDCTETVFPGWEFLFCIADNYPGSAPSKPMPDTPGEALEAAAAGRLSAKERNRYHRLS